MELKKDQLCLKKSKAFNAKLKMSQSEYLYAFMGLFSPLFGVVAQFLSWP